MHFSQRKQNLLIICKNSGHLIGISNDGSIARKNRKLVVLNNNDIKKWDNIKYKIMEEILIAKFTQVPIAKQVLLLTQNAILLHGATGIPILEKVRNNLKI